MYQQAAYFHGDLIQSHRIKLMNRIRLKDIKIILATDVVECFYSVVSWNRFTESRHGDKL